VQAADSENPSVSASADLSITVTLVPLTITTASLPAATADVAYSAKLAAAGGIRPYTWLVTAGALPAGLSLNPATGAISGKPTASGAGGSGAGAGKPTAPGTPSFTVTVSDGENPAASASADLSIAVTVAPLAITTVSVLPAAATGVPYSVKLAAAGGLTPYTWSLTQGSLPAGLKLHAATGVISGTPAVSGASTFTAQVSDGENPPAIVSATFSLVSGVPTEAISTTPGAGGPLGSTTVTDTATLTGGSSPTGTITFNLYGPSDTADCSGTPADTETAAVSGNGTATTPTGYTPATTGTYWWTASYSGDSGNNAVSTTCGDEQVVIGQATPAIGVNGGGGGPIGASVNASATLTGGFSPTGTITFTLYSQPDCTNPLATSPQGVNGDGNYTSVSFTPLAVGQYYWVAAYSGDSSNLAVASGCNDAQVPIFRGAGPTITTSAQPQVVDAGTLFADVATVTGGFDPTGLITFTLYSTPGCTGEITHTGTGASGDGNYASPPVALPEETGIFFWVATYSGDVNNFPSGSACDADPVEIDTP
jgi:Putative Ig domain